MDNLTQGRLKQLLSYNKATGVFIWRERRGMAQKGSVAGTRVGKYVHIYVDNRPYRAHNLAWLYVYGRWPKVRLDHRNRKGYDNKFRNLREATHQQNCRNRRHRRKLYPGVYNPRPGVYYVGLRVDGKPLPLGRYSSKKEAVKVARDARRKIYGVFCS